MQGLQLRGWTRNELTTSPSHGPLCAGVAAQPCFFHRHYRFFWCTRPPPVIYLPFLPFQSPATWVRLSHGQEYAFAQWGKVAYIRDQIWWFLSVMDSIPRIALTPTTTLPLSNLNSGHACNHLATDTHHHHESQSGRSQHCPGTRDSITLRSILTDVVERTNTDR